MENSSSSNPNNEALCKLFVGNVNKSTTEESFKSYFAAFGKLRDIVLMKDNNNPTINRGFGFVTPEDVEVTDKILLEPIHKLDGRDLDIKRALPKDIDDPLHHMRTPRIFLGGLPHNLTEEDITNFFNDHYGNFGPVKEVIIKKDRQTGRPRGFCFVSFENCHVVDKILLEMRYPVIKEKRCEVKKADPGVPITGAPPSQLSHYSSRGTQQQVQAPYSSNRPQFNRNSTGMGNPQGDMYAMTSAAAYDYNNSYPSGGGMVGYPQSNAYYGYYSGQSMGSQYQNQPSPTAYPQYGGYQDQRNLRSNYQRPQNSMNTSSRGRPY